MGSSSRFYSKTYIDFFTKSGSCRRHQSGVWTGVTSLKTSFWRKIKRYLCVQVQVKRTIANRKAQNTWSVSLSLQSIQPDWVHKLDLKKAAGCFQNTIYMIQQHDPIYIIQHIWANLTESISWIWRRWWVASNATSPHFVQVRHRSPRVCKKISRISVTLDKIPNKIDIVQIRFHVYEYPQNQ